MTGEKSYIPHFAVAGLVGALAIAAHLIMPSEGKINVANPDPVGLTEICWGHTGKIAAGQHETDEQCEQYLVDDLTNADAAVMRLVHVSLTPERRGALDDFVYNEGSGTFAKSSVLRDLNDGNTEQACLDMLKYHYAGGTSLHGLEKRRAVEYALCMRGVK